MDLRIARPADARALIDLVNGVAAEDPVLGIDAFPLDVASEEAFLRGADPLVHLCLLAFDGDAVAGHLYASRGTSSKLAHVGNLAVVVAPSHRRQGVGEALLSHACSWARTVGVRKLTLSVLATNAPARALFEKAGFAVEATRRGQFLIEGSGVDELLMARWLDEGGPDRG